MFKVDNLEVGKEYSRNYLADLWGYDSYKAIANGIITNKKKSNKIILFVTKEKQSSLTQYEDHFDSENGLLYMEGTNSHTNDDRLINSPISGDKIYLFYRAKHRRDFEYFGRVYLADYKENKEKNKPSKFVFSIDEHRAKAYSEVSLEVACDCSIDKQDEENMYLGAKEGKVISVKHKKIERNLKNRAEAIKEHGTTCLVCGFNFNKFYGKDLARDFIEVHHIKPLHTYKGEEIIINPKTDLVPVCANCHRMLHRKMDKAITIEKLKNFIVDNIRSKKLS